MKEAKEKAISAMKNGFPISDDEREAIHDWYTKHLKEKHARGNSRMGYKISQRSICYEFVPTPIGTFGTCKCGLCGEEFEFREL